MAEKNTWFNAVPQNILMVVIILPVILLGIFYLQLQEVRDYRQLQHTSLEKQLRGIALFAHSYIEQSVAVNDEANTEQMIQHLSAHPLINEALLTNKFAGIVAPRVRALEIAPDIEIEQILSNNSAESRFSHNEESVSLYLPVKVDDEVTGVLKILSKQPILAKPLVTIEFLIRLLIVSIILVAGLLLALKLINLRWQALHDQFQEALEEKSNPEAKQAPDKIVKAHEMLYSRYLLKVRRRTDTNNKIT